MSSSGVDSTIREAVKPVVTFGGVFVTTFGVLWLLIEPLAVFGLDGRLKHAGLIGYLGLVAIAALLAAVVVLLRLLRAYRVAAIGDPGLLGLATAELITQQRPAVDNALDAALAATAADTIDVDHPTLPESDRFMVAGTLRFLRRLGLITTDRGIVHATSGDARVLIAQMSDHAANNQSLGGNWRSQAPADEALRRELLSAVERSRGRLTPLTPVRFTKSVIVLVTTSVDGERRLLTHSSSAWGAQYDWFIGGIVEPEDDSLDAGARRELWEETGIDGTHVSAMRHLETVHDDRVSARLRVLTSYIYEVFHCTLNASVTLPYPRGEVTVTIRGKQNIEHLSWLSVRDLTTSVDLQRDAPELTARMAGRLTSEPTSIPRDQLQIVHP